jgi:glutamyl-tRNA reductase
VNRTVAKARELTDRWGSQAKGFENLEEELASADIIIASTSAPHTLFNLKNIGAAMGFRPERQLILMDIAVPRDVDADVRQLDRVHVYDIDQLNDKLSRSVEDRKARRSCRKVGAIAYDSRILRWRKS